MARRKPPPATRGNILPRHLIDLRGVTGSAYPAIWQERKAWLTAHGIDWRDWSQVYPVVKASKAAHGITTAEQRLFVTDPNQGPPE